VVRLALSLLVFTTGCQAIAGIEDVTLAAAGDSASSVAETSADTFGDSTATDTGTGETASCTSSRGPAMVEVVHPDGSFCMDVTEVTNEQFAEYAKAPPSVTPPSRCTGVVLAYPGPVGDPKGPQFNVSWCDAWAFCNWAGKRLCGPLDTAKPIGGDNSEWTWSCTNGGTTSFPYGDTFNSTACVSGRTDGSALPAAAASFAGCKGTAAPYDALHDLSGNVSEWVDECSGTKCRALGGYYGDTDTQALRCASINSSTGATVEHEVGTVLSGLGFRCCR
jgi:formylglycine-generating enzyme required for sulfatase activity